MSWNPEEDSGYDFSAYNRPVNEQSETKYTDPRSYTPDAEGTSASTSDVQGERAENVPVVGQVRFVAYKGPSHDEHPVAAGDVLDEESGDGPPPGRARPRLATALAVASNFGLTIVTALLSVAVYSALFGWTFAIGLVLLLFIHEMGHAIVMKLKGMRVGGMIFIPLLGAAVFMNRMPTNARDEAEVGLAGPVAGALAAATCLWIAQMQPAQAGIWASLAFFGFLMNLFNLIPVLPFDGGRVAAAIDRRIWIVGFAAMVIFQIWEWINHINSIWLIFFIVLATMQMFTRREKTPEAQAYYAVPLYERVILGVSYFGLAAVLVLGMTLAHSLVLPFGQ